MERTVLELDERGREPSLAGDGASWGVSIEEVPTTSTGARRHGRGAARRVAKTALIVTVGVLAVAAGLRNAHTISLAIGSVARANPWWIAVTFGLAATTYIGAAVALRAASGHPLPIGRTTASQLAAACANRIAPAGLGAMATNLRYLEREGVPRADGIASIASTSLASFVVHVVLTTLAVVLGGSGLPLRAVPIPHGVPLLVVVVVAVLGVTALVVRRIPRLATSARTVVRDLRTLVRDGRRLARLLAGTLLVTLGHAFAFAAATAALGIRLPLAGVLAVFLTGSAVAAAAPVPSGLGPIEAALVTGLTGLGGAVAPAIAAVLTFRLVTYWFPVLPGVLAHRVLWGAGRHEPRGRKCGITAAAAPLQCSMVADGGSGW